MTDIVERLRKEAAYESQFKDAPQWKTCINKKTHDMCIEAADTIEALRKQVALTSDENSKSYFAKYLVEKNKRQHLDEQLAAMTQERDTLNAALDAKITICGDGNLAIAQARIKELREALKRIGMGEARDGCIASTGDLIDMAYETLAQPDNSSALAEYNKRLIAAYLAEQEPVGYFHKHQYGDNCVVIENVVDSAKDEEGVFPLYAAPPLPEPVRKQETIMPGRYKGDALCAAPSSEEVREIVGRLRNDETDLFRLQEKAADMIERLAARVDELKQANSDLATAAILPDGCVVVPREPTLEMVIAGENYVGRHAYKAMIAAGEIKP